MFNVGLITFNALSYTLSLQVSGTYGHVSKLIGNNI